MRKFKEIYKNRLKLFCFLLIAIGVFFRFYNLTWGAPFFFHPDERNIASSVSQLSFPEQMNPKFFAYGSLPIYIIYFIGFLKNLFVESFFSVNINSHFVLFEDAIIIGRIISALFSIILLTLIYKITRIVGNKKSSVIAITLASLSIGFIQYSHFATFEIWLSLFTTLLLFLIIKYSQKETIYILILISIVLGILVSTKISSLIFLPLIILIITILDILKIKRNNKISFFSIEKIILKIVVITAIALLVVFTTSPYYWIDKASFLGSINYETSVATGKLPVFYTQGFLDSIPVIYQVFKVYPFILNPFILILFTLIIFPFIFKEIKNKNYKTLLVIVFFLVTFFSQAFLYVKWIRYYIPTLSFIYIIIGTAFTNRSEKNKEDKYRRLLTYLILIISLIYSFSFFKTVLLNKSTPIIASEWSRKNINENSKIISEVYDLGIIPFNDRFHSIKLFNFYDLEVEKTNQDELNQLVKNAEYIILPSQRILKDRIEKPKYFPKGNKFYKNLLSENLGFKKIYESPCDLFCKILYLNSPIFSYETTANVFDRPQVLIFKNEKVN